MFIAKAHKTNEGKIVLALCDKNILGKKFEDGMLLLDLSSDFYKGREVKAEELPIMFMGSYVVNIVGKDSIGIALKEGIIGKKNVSMIKGIPYAQSLIE